MKFFHTKQGAIAQILAFFHLLSHSAISLPKLLQFIFYFQRIARNTVGQQQTL